MKEDAARPGPARAPLVDWDRARHMLPGGEQGVLEVAGMLLEECPRRLTEIREGLALGRSSEVRRAAHTLQTQTLLFGAEAVAKVAGKMEACAARSDFAACRVLLPRLQKFLRQLCAEVEVALQAAGGT